MQTRFIILDDDCCANTVNILALKKALPKVKLDMLSFTDPVEGLQYLKTDYACNPVPAILFLDICMPAIGGWQVLQQLEKLPHSVLKYLTIYMLSTSVNPADIEKADNHDLVTGFLPKPLSHSLPLLLNTVKNKALIYRDTSAMFLSATFAC